MAVAYHHILDALTGVSNKFEVLKLPGSEESVKGLIPWMRSCEVFDFGELTFEQYHDLGVGLETGNYGPMITEEEIGFWRAGLLPLPSPFCWFEFTQGGVKHCVLVANAFDKWFVTRLDAAEFEQSNQYVYDGTITSSPYPQHLAREIEWEVAGNPEYTKIFPDERTLKNSGGVLKLSIYLTLMLNSKTTEVTRFIAPTKLNSAREKKGLTKLPDHRVVTIVPVRFINESIAEGERTHRSPRLHWRRSHLRQYADGKKTVIPRCLVGRADLGEVSHEYRIKQ